MRVSIVLLLTVLLGAWLLPAMAAPNRDAIEVGGTLLLPVLPIADLMGAAVTADRQTGGICVTKGEQTLGLAPNRPQVTLNGKAQLLPVPIVMWHGTYYAPARLLAKALILRMDWDDKDQVLSLVPPLGKYQQYAAGMRLRWTADDFDGDGTEEIAYAMTTLATREIELWVVRGNDVLWSRTYDAASKLTVANLQALSLPNTKRPALVLTVDTVENDKPVQKAFGFTWSDGAFHEVTLPKENKKKR